MPREYAKRRLLKHLVGLPVQTVRATNAYCALVVDDETLEVLSSVAKNYDLLDNGIAVIQSISKTRQPLPELDCIYYLSPRKDVVERLIQDFKSEKKPSYRSAHIFWSTSIQREKQLIELIAGANSLIPRIKSFIDFNMHFCAYESRTFHLSMPMALRQILSRTIPPHDSLLRSIAAKLATVCITMGDMSSVRFYGDSEHARTNRQIAQYVQEYFDSIKPEECTRGSSELIILDRSLDPCVLLLHEYSYQALAYDVLEVPVCSIKMPEENDTYKFKDEKDEEHTVLLSETDELFVRYRHKHIASVITGVRDELLKFAADNATAQYKKAGAGKLDIGGAIQALPQYSEMTTKFTNHMKVSEACFSTLEKTGIFRAGVLEQDLATGVDKHGKTIQVLKTLEELARLVSDKSSIAMGERVRLLLLYFTMMDGVQPEDKRKMIRGAGMSVEVEKLIDTFSDIGLVPESKDSKEGSLKHVHRNHKNEDRLQLNKRRAKSAQYELSRFEPLIKELMESAAAKRLPRSNFPYLADPDFETGAANRYNDSAAAAAGTRLRAAQIDWDWTAATGEVASPETATSILQNSGKRKIIFFVLGGISFSEIRTAYEVTKATTADVYIGGTSIVSPPMLFEILRQDV